MNWKLFKINWKEARENFSRTYIIKYLIYFYLRYSKWILKSLIYYIIKFKHKHIWNINFKCIICKKGKRDIDQMLRDKRNENEWD